MLSIAISSHSGDFIFEIPYDFVVLDSCDHVLSAGKESELACLP